MKSPLKLLLLLIANLQLSYSFGIEFLSLINLPKIHPECAVSLVKASTAILPQFDSIGHHVLHANQVLINKLLESNFDPVLKKKLILQVIDLTRQGDEMGGKILQDYYNFIDFLL
jgi:hypothetical protein